MLSTISRTKRTPTSVIRTRSPAGGAVSSARSLAPSFVRNLRYCNECHGIVLLCFARCITRRIVLRKIMISQSLMSQFGAGAALFHICNTAYIIQGTYMTGRGHLGNSSDANLPLLRIENQCADLDRLPIWRIFRTSHVGERGVRRQARLILLRVIALDERDFVRSLIPEVVPL